jgi:hypothetical protein
MRVQMARLEHGPDMNVARLRELLIKDCPQFVNWRDPWRAYWGQTAAAFC